MKVSEDGWVWYTMEHNSNELEWQAQYNNVRETSGSTPNANRYIVEGFVGTWKILLQLLIEMYFIFIAIYLINIFLKVSSHISLINIKNNNYGLLWPILPFWWFKFPAILVLIHRGILLIKFLDIKNDSQNPST